MIKIIESNDLSPDEILSLETELGNLRRNYRLTDGDEINVPKKQRIKEILQILDGQSDIGTLQQRKPKGKTTNVFVTNMK